MDIPTHPELVERIAAFLARHEMAPSRLGRLATGEPDLIGSIRKGRSPNLETLNKLATVMAEHDALLAPLEEGHVVMATADTAEWPVASSGMTAEISGGSVAETVSEAEAPPHPFAAGGASPPTSIRTCPTCDAPATPTRPARSSPGLPRGAEPFDMAQDRTEAA